MIRTISIPYYTSSMDLHVEEKNLKTVITAKTEDYVPEKSPKELIEDALEHPIGTPKLSELAKGENKARSCHQRSHQGCPQQTDAADPFKGNPQRKS